MKRVNMAYTFRIPENTTQLTHADWVDVVLYSLDIFLYGILRINGTGQKPVVPGHLVNLFEKDDPEFTKECDTAIGEIINTAYGLVRYIAEPALSREHQYVQHIRYKVIMEQWVKMYVYIARVDEVG